MTEEKITYRIKDGVDLFEELPKFGYTYHGNYFRGDNWIKKCKFHKEKMAWDDVPQGILVQGDWNNRTIHWQFPYRKEVIGEEVNRIEIEDLVSAGLVEKIA